jgi:hypothetical protein
VADIFRARRRDGQYAGGIHRRSHAVSYEFFSSKLLNIVVNSHGGPGAIYFGGLGSNPIMKDDLPALAFLKKGRGAGTICSSPATRQQVHEGWISARHWR